MLFPHVILLLFLLVLALPVLILIGFFQAAKLGFGALGISPGGVLLILLLMLAGSLVNIPLTRLRVVEVQERGIFGFFRRRRVAQGIFLNAGGGLIPLALAVYLLPGLPLAETGAAVFLTMLSVNRLARQTPRRGISIPMVVTALLAAFFAILLAPEAAAPVAFVSGVFGVLIGADLMHVPAMLRRGEGAVSIGGAGVFDGIFLVSILSALLAGL